MNRAKFFAALRRRSSGVFGTSLSQPQVTGTEAILDSCIRYGVKAPHHVADILAQVYHETAGYMLGIKETVMPHHKDKNPSDATVIARLERAWKKGQLTWVKTPYWRDGWFGRGPIMTTHEDGYRRIGTAIGVDLVSDPNRILEPAIGAATAVVGMRDGVYTGKKLSDFAFPSALNNPPSKHPRRIVNGKDGTDGDIRDYHLAFYTALMEAGWTGEAEEPDIPWIDDEEMRADPPQEPQDTPQPVPGPKPAPEPPSESGGFWAAVTKLLSAIFKRN